MPEYQQAKRVCDVVMKGGVTSGVLYPPAIDEIAQRFWLCGVGGTSAGAIAAALAAAAEFRRRQGDDTGYRLLAEVPAEVGGPGQIFSLFRPDEATQDLFTLAIRTQAASSGGFLAKTAVALSAFRQLVLQDGLRPLVDNHMGLCTGLANGQPRVDHGLPPLTEWLGRKLDTIAGISGRPLTFGDLWNAPAPPPLAGTGIRPNPSIRLQLISTCLTFGRPYALPYLDNRFAFSPDELRAFLPGYMLDYLVDTGRALKASLKRLAMPDHLLPLPQRDKMPVLLAVRMSLSFPLLFSTVPLYYPNFHADSDRPRYDPVRFADGGITSNLPVHFFDSPLPRWPTLAINLQYAKTAGEYGRRRVGPDGVHLPASTAQGTLDLFHDFLELTRPAGRARPSSLRRLAGLIGAIFRSAQNWSDNSFLVLPGYRDRVAEIWLDPTEGGLNLDMPPETVRRLVEKGKAAGRLLVERFADASSAQPMSWTGHRWTRFRSALAALEDYIAALQNAVDHPLPDEPTLSDLLDDVSAPPGYRFESCGGLSAAERLAAARATLDDLLRHARSAQASHTCDETDQTGDAFCAGPRPRVSLQARASLVDDR